MLATAARRTFGYRRAATASWLRKYHLPRVTDQRGLTLLNNMSMNQGTAYPLSARDRLGLRGLMPPIYRDLETQLHNSYIQFKKCETPLSKYQFLHRYALRTSQTVANAPSRPSSRVQLAA